VKALLRVDDKKELSNPPRIQEKEFKEPDSDTSQERKRMVTDLVLKLPRKSRPEQLGVSVSSRHPGFEV
jgi:hypothetical protein